MFMQYANVETYAEFHVSTKILLDTFRLCTPITCISDKFIYKCCNITVRYYKRSDVYGYYMCIAYLKRLINIKPVNSAP